MYGVHKLEFIEEPGRRKIPVVIMDDEEIHDEIQSARQFGNCDEIINKR